MTHCDATYKGTMMERRGFPGAQSTGRPLGMFVPEGSLGEKERELVARLEAYHGRLGWSEVLEVLRGEGPNDGRNRPTFS